MDPEIPLETTPDESPDLDLSAAFAPDTLPEPSPEPTQEESPENLGRLKTGSAWDTGENKPGKSDPEPAPEPGPEPVKSEKPEEVPDGEKLFAGDTKQIQSWNDLRNRYNQTKQELAELKKLAESGPKTDGAELEKLRAIDRIRNSDAYAAEVMAPQSEALNRAKQIAQYAHIDEEDIDDLFRAENPYEAERLLQSFGDAVAENQLRPLVQAALEARQKSEEVLKSSDPLAELKEWEAKSIELVKNNQQLLQQHETRMDKAALESAFINRISKTPIGGIPAAEKIKNELLAEIESGQPIERETLHESLFHLKAVPLYFGHMEKQAARIAELEKQIQSVSGDYQPGPEGVNRQRQQSGRLEPGKAWSTG